MPSWVRIASTASLSPLTRLTTPSGTPASRASSTSRVGQDGARSDGFRMKVLPQAIDSGNIQSGIIAGKLNGCDTRTDANGLPDRIGIHAGAHILGEITTQQMRDSAGELDDLATAQDIALGVINRLAMLTRDHLGELLLVCEDQLVAGGTWSARDGSGGIADHAGKRGLGCGHGRIHVSIVRQGIYVGGLARLMAGLNTWTGAARCCRPSRRR